MHEASLHVEIVGQGPDLVMIHGWGASGGVWRSWALYELAQHFRCHLVDLPGHGESPLVPCAEQTGEALKRCWLAAIERTLPKRPFFLLGWSLGGLLAQCVASEHSGRVRRLIVLASTPRFVQAEGWRWGISPTLMRDFVHALGEDAWQLLRRFWLLQWRGDRRAGELMRRFVQEMRRRRLPHLQALREGLILLKTLDCRPVLPRLDLPTLWLLGGKDPLVDAGLVEAVTRWQPHAQVKILPQAAHLPFRAWGEETACIIRDFLLQDDTLVQASAVRSMQRQER